MIAVRINKQSNVVSTRPMLIGEFNANTFSDMSESGDASCALCQCKDVSRSPVPDAPSFLSCLKCRAALSPAYQFAVRRRRGAATGRGCRAPPAFEHRFPAFSLECDQPAGLFFCGRLEICCGCFGEGNWIYPRQTRHMPVQQTSFSQGTAGNLILSSWTVSDLIQSFEVTVWSKALKCKCGLCITVY